MSFRMPSPEDNMIEEMLEIENEGVGYQNRETVWISGMTGEGKVGVMEKIVKLKEKWAGTPYMMVADACKVMLDWDEVRSGEDRDTFLEWMMELDTNRLVEEAGHIISILKTQWQYEELDIVAEKMLTESVEILTISVVAWNMEMGALDELQEDGNHGTSPTKKETRDAQTCLS